MINPVSIDNYPVIKEILNTPNERRVIEFKPSLPWPKRIDDSRLGRKIQEVIKSILAMSNLRDVGRIILGVEKDASTGNYRPVGMKKKHLATYDQDFIYQIVRNFGSPEPKFEVVCIESNGNFFIVFEVQSFSHTPVICRNNKKNLKKLENSAIYIRTHKPENKKVTESPEMQEIINLAVDKELALFSSRVGSLFKSMSKMQVVRTSDEMKFKKQRGKL